MNRTKSRWWSVLVLLLVYSVSEKVSAQEGTVPEPKKLEVTDALVRKYLGYEKQKLKLAKDYAQKTRAVEEKAGDSEPTSDGTGKISKMFNDKLDALRKRAGLTREMEQILDDLAFSIISAKLILQNNSADLKDLLSEMSEEERAQNEKFIVEMQAAQREVASLLEIRRKYGDDAVNVFIRHDQELTEIHAELAKFMMPTKGP